MERRAPGDPRDLLPSEAAPLARARPKRVQEYAAGRACARAALATFGVQGFALLTADDRQPLWPAGIVGSITHTAGLCAAAVARRASVSAVGIDSEIVGAPTPDIWSTICHPEELAWVGSLAPDRRPAAVTLLFSAKEAFYKCQYPLTREWLDFHDLRLDVSWEDARPGGEFAVQAMRTLRFERHAGLPLTGRYVFHEQFVSAAVSVTAAQ